MMAIVLIPPAFVPLRAILFRSSCIGTVKLATDCLKKQPSFSSAWSGNSPIRRGWKLSLPVAVMLLNCFKDCLTLVAEALMSPANSSDIQRLISLTSKIPNNCSSTLGWYAPPLPVPRLGIDVGYFDWAGYEFLIAFGIDLGHDQT